MSAGRVRIVALVAAVVLLLAEGCTVSQPDADAWRDQARQTLDDVASEVATARLTLAQMDRDKLPASYGVTVLAEAEEAASKSEESLSSVQAPRRLRTRADQVLAVVGRAVEAVQRARETAVAGKYHVPALLRALDRLHTMLDKRRARL